MDNRPIGFFDSGLGGLTCIAPARRALPQERILYYGDTARTPYGSKSLDTIKTFSRQIGDFLISQDVKMLVIACNTISSTSLQDLQQRYPDVPVVGIIEPTANAIARSCTRDNRIGIIGTKATIRNNTYEASILRLNPELKLYSMACPAFVPLIEEGILRNQIMDLTIRYYMDQFIEYNEIDTLVLGCTHYPLIRENIEKLYPHLKIINPSEEIVASITASLNEKDLHGKEATAENTFYASDLSENFVNMINRIFENSEFKVAFKSFEL